MTDTVLQLGTECLSINSVNINYLLNHCEQILSEHRLSDPDLYRIIEEQKMIATAIAHTEKDNPPPIKSNEKNTCVLPELIESIYFRQFQQATLKGKIAT